MADKRALKILFQHFWGPGGWRKEDGKRSTPEDVAYAKAAGVMFDAAPVRHDDVMHRLVALVGELSPALVADAFLVSLSTRRLDIRSALGSYAVFRHVSPHHSPASNARCPTCGLVDERDEDFSILNYERFKWAGVRHLDASYAAFDLELFVEEPLAKFTDEDVHIFRALVSTIRGAPPSTTSATLHRLLSPLLKSTKDERDILVGILGHCGILNTPGHPAGRTAFVPYQARELPSRRFVDMAYPACWWRGSDGVDEVALREYFGHVL